MLKTKSALVRSDGVVELDPETSVDLDISVVVDPRNAEADNSFGLGHSFKQADLFIFGMRLYNKFERLEHLFDGLNKLILAGVSLSYIFKYSCHIFIHLDFLLYNRIYKL